MSSNQHYRNAPPPGGNKRSKVRAVLSRALRSGFNIAGTRQTDLERKCRTSRNFRLVRHCHYHRIHRRYLVRPVVTD